MTALLTAIDELKKVVMQCKPLEVIKAVLMENREKLVEEALTAGNLQEELLGENGLLSSLYGDERRVVEMILQKLVNVATRGPDQIDGLTLALDQAISVLRLNETVFDDVRKLAELQESRITTLKEMVQLLRKGECNG